MSGFSLGAEVKLAKPSRCGARRVWPACLFVMGVVVHTGVGTLLAEEAKQNCFVAAAAKELDKQQSANAASPRRKKHKPKDVTSKPAASAQPAATANENATCKRLLYEEIANSQVFDLLLSKPIIGAANAAVADQVPE